MNAHTFSNERDENGETVDDRLARADAERRLLASNVPGSLANRIRKLLALGMYQDPNWEDISLSTEHTLPRVVAIQIRAIANALDAAQTENSDREPELTELSPFDAAIALGGIATLLEVGMSIQSDIRCAEDYAKSVAAKKEASE